MLSLLNYSPYRIETSQMITLKPISIAVVNPFKTSQPTQTSYNYELETTPPSTTINIQISQLTTASTQTSLLTADNTKTSLLTAVNTNERHASVK